MMGLYFTDSIARVRPTRDVWGTTTSDDVAYLAARVTIKNARVRNAAGEETVASGVVMLAPDADVLLTDKIVLDVESGDSYTESDEHAILAIQPVKDFTTQFQRVYIA